MLISRRHSRSASQQQLARLCRRQQTRDWPIGPTFGKLMQAASDAFRVFVRDGIRHIRPGLVVKADDDGKRTTLASLKVHDGRLVEWAATQKGTDSPLDRVKSGLTSQASRRDPMLYLSRATAPSPMHASPLPRNVSYRTVLLPMLDPTDRRRSNRELLRSLGVDCSVRLDKLPVPATKCDNAVANGAGFLGGVSCPSGNSSRGAQAWYAPEFSRATSQRCSKKSPRAAR